MVWEQCRLLVWGRLHLSAQSGHQVHRIIHRNAECDRGDNAGPQVEHRARETHQPEKNHNRKDVGDHGDQTNPRGQKHSRHNEEDDAGGKRETADLAG